MPPRGLLSALKFHRNLPLLCVSLALPPLCSMYEEDGPYMPQRGLVPPPPPPRRPGGGFGPPAAHEGLGFEPYEQLFPPPPPPRPLPGVCLCVCVCVWCVCACVCVVCVY